MLRKFYLSFKNSTQQLSIDMRTVVNVEKREIVCAKTNYPSIYELVRYYKQF